MIFEVVASCAITAAGATTVARRCVGARTGAGVYTVTLDQALNSAEGILLVTSRTLTGNTNISTGHTSDTVKAVNSFVVAAATDTAFDFLAVRIAAGSF